ncbi:ATP-binding protein [Nocardia sp. CDC153]|uniref:sensor histidine kinase n=1 Tax=Nocardia sp. CDC153 TaxID=3112167 RepID=UPI002DBFF4ED|nr:ATP-binding protein [Nocardia sp. CDC153]MEC3952609.1 ATP-binding protein [Nocardia sp. CDC153]
MRRIPDWLRPSHWGLRIRSAIAAALTVGAVLLLAAGAMLGLLNRSLLREIDAAAGTRADAIAGELTRGSLADLPESLVEATGQIGVVQIVDARGRIARESNPKLAAPLLDPATVEQPESGRRPAPAYDEDLRVSARSVTTPEGRFVVLVAGDSEPAEHAVKRVAALIAVGGPIVVAAAALATYLLVGRSLRSVEEIRSRVAGIGSAGLSERVPVPVARDEIARLAVTMNDMLARIEAGHEAQQRFVGDASHELRSPLAAITAALELARDRPEVLDAELIGGTLLPEAERMRQLIEDLLTLATADESGLDVRGEDVDLDDLAAEQAAALRARGGYTVRTDIAAVRIQGDRPKLARALRNIVDNAAAHARETVAISVAQSGDRATVVVDDDGPGIPVADRERVFGRFVRLEADRARATGGSGLGLAIVTEIVAAHGGTVTIGESPWGGARFVVDLPVGIDHPIADAP